MPDQEMRDPVGAALALGGMTILFTTEPETWPVFEAWAAVHCPELLANCSRELAMKLAVQLANEMGYRGPS